MQKGCFIILYVLTATISASSHECLDSTKTTGEKVEVDQAGSNFSIAFSLSRHCPALLFIMVYVTQGGQIRDYCHFFHKDGKCASSSHSLCICDHPQQQQEERYVIKGNLSQSEAAGMELMLTGTAESDRVVFRSVVRVAVRPDIVNSTVEDDTQQSVSINITRENPPVSKEDGTTDSAGGREDSVNVPDHTTITYTAMGCISFVVVVISVVFGVILYRKVLNASPKPAVTEHVHREPEGQEVIELPRLPQLPPLPQLPVGNQGDPGNRESALSIANHFYEKIDDDINSIRPVSSHAGWSETEFDSDHDNCPRAAEPGDYQNETPQVHNRNKQPEIPYENARSDLPGEMAARANLPYENARSDLPYENAASSNLPGEIATRSDLPYENAASSNLPGEIATKSELPYENARPELAYQNTSEEFAPGAEGARSGGEGGRRMKGGPKQTADGYMYMRGNRAQTPEESLDGYLRMNRIPVCAQVHATPKP